MSQAEMMSLATDRIALDVPSVSAGVDEQGVEWFKLRPEDFWGSPRHWANRVRSHQRKRAK